MKGEGLKFTFLDELCKQTTPLSLEELEKLTIDYDQDLDDTIGVAPTSYFSEDDVVEVGTSHIPNQKFQGAKSRLKAIRLVLRTEMPCSCF